MDFAAFNDRQTQAYAAQARAQWGSTKEYAEYEAKCKGRSKQARQDLTDQMANLFAAFGALRGKDADSDEVREQVKKLQRFITENFYTCTDEILASLGQMYVADEAFRQNIDQAGGAGTAAFASLAIQAYCKAV